MTNVTERYKKDEFDERFLAKFNASLADLEKEYVAAQKPSHDPIVFICGAPRSGTTLLSQVLAKTEVFTYIDNFVARFWRAPFIGLYLENLIGLRKSLSHSAYSFESDFGRTHELLDPHEFAYFWEYWLKPDISHHMIPVSHLRKIDIKGLKKEMNAIINFHRKPIFFKSIWFLSNPVLAYKIFPHVYFITIKRDMLSNILSILTAREKYHGDENVWFSVRLSNYEEITSQPIEYQIVRQIKDIYEEITRQCIDFPDRMLNISYEELCDNPLNTVLKIINHIGLKKVDPVRLRNKLPEKFNSKNKKGPFERLKRFEKFL